MKVGDLVKNRQGQWGIVMALGYSGEFSSYDNCAWINPDIHVFTATGRRLWSYNALKVISEKR